MKKQPKVTAATRAAFMEAYYDLVLNKRQKKITIQLLSERAGYNRSTFYEYFKDIQDLISNIEQDMVECIDMKLRTYMGNADLDTVFVTVFTELYVEYDAPLRLLFTEENAPHFSHIVKARLAPIFAEHIPNHDSAETTYIVEFYLSGILAIVSRWFSEKDELSLEEFARIIKSIVDGMGKSGLLMFGN